MISIIDLILRENVKAMPRNVVQLQKPMYSHEEWGGHLYVFAPYFKVIRRDKFDVAEISKLYCLVSIASKWGGDLNFEVYDVTREDGVVRSSSTFEFVSPEDFKEKLRSGECRCLRSSIKI